MTLTAVITAVGTTIMAGLVAIAVTINLTPQYALYIVLGLVALLGGKNAVQAFLKFRDAIAQLAGDPHVHAPELKSRTTEGKVHEAMLKKLDKVLDRYEELQNGFNSLKNYVRVELTALREEVATAQNDIDALGETVATLERQLTATQALVRRHGIDLPKEGS